MRYAMIAMKTIEEIRHDWLSRLIEKHGTVAALNEALGRARTDATLLQIKNQAPNTRSGKPRNMGSDLAREIEEKLGLERGMLDNPISALPPVFTAAQSTPAPGYVRFDRLDVQAAAGGGLLANEYPEVIEQIDVLERWAREHFDGMLFSRIRVISARGTSMSGTIENGDVLFVDVSVNHYDSEAVYVIARPDVGVQVKRLQMMGGGRLAILSDNPKNMPEYVEKDEMNTVRICGRVLASWTLKRLWIESAG